MDLLKGICVFILLSLVKGELTLFPSEKEIIYSWQAELLSGTELPQSMTSVWNFSATLIIQQKTDNFTTFKITNVATTESKLESAPVILPFEANYVNGLLTKFYTDPGDRKWSVNLKRALVTLLQLNLENINQPAFTNDESGLYGTCKTQYIITKNDYIQVHKIVDMQSCSNYKELRWSSAPNFICPNNYQKELINHGEREYTLDSEGKALIRNVQSKGLVWLQPYQSQVEAHYSSVRQTLTLVDVKPITDQITVNSGQAEKKETDLIWEPLNLDPTYGKPPTNKTAVLSEIHYMLGETSDSLSSWEVGAQGLNNETLFRLVDLMWWLDVEDWEKLYNSVTLGTSYRQETIQQIFWELVPEVGSSASVLFIKDLVRNNKVKGFHATRLLINFPFRLRQPTEDLLTQCEEFLRLGDVGEEVKSSAVLSFATMIHKTCSVHCKADTLDRYTKIYLDRFKESTLHGDRMLYLQGLCNIELPQILEYLTPIITGQASQDRHLRFLAVWAVLNSAYTNPSKVYEIFWPILTNRSESLEVRVASLTILILAKPTSAGLISLFWFMQTEPSQQLYQFYYTTIQSLTQTTFPCYAHLRVVASHLSRFVHLRSNNWATGNYILDYEEPDRGYGGLIQMLMVGSERTGLPNVVIAVAEQHALGVATEYTAYLKVEGLGEAIRHLFHNKTEYSITKVFDTLQKMTVPIRRSEDIHLELIIKVDGRTIVSYFLNETNFYNLTSVARKLSSLYFEFSVNYQRLTFPLALIRQQANDFGITTLSQVRSSLFVSARGRVSQDDEGAARNAELDLRFTWHGVTSLRLFSPLSNTWYGADRSRSLHIRLPFATQIIVNYSKPFIKITAVRHRDFAAGSRLGGVWHTMTRIVAGRTHKNTPHNITDEWTMDSEDLGARLGASVFDCPGATNLRDVLHLLKRAFLAKNKNYQMVPGGVAVLGLFSLKEQLAFQPPGGNCGVMLSFVPLLNQVEPVLFIERNQLSLSMTRRDGLLWEIHAGVKKLHDGNKELAFKLYHAPSISVTTGGIWRVIQFEGAFIIPSRKSGVFHPPAPLTGYTFVSWGDALPSNSDKAAVVDLKIIPGNNESHNSLCIGFKPTCLQTFTDLATRQTVNVQYANLPGWLKTAAHALFPENFQTESTSTEFAFNSPVPFPWNSKGLCAISDDAVLSLDNATLKHSLHEQYTIAVADCSAESHFSTLVKKIPNSGVLGAKVLSGEDEVEFLPSSAAVGAFQVIFNEKVLTENEFSTVFNNDTQIVILKKDSGMIEVELKNGVVFQHYTSTVVFLVPGMFRGFTCGLCGDYNSDTNNDEPLQNYFTKV
ncbi:uncharacterized protein LOC142328230 [Lycorma delicatula]|uniref:uncharacterized protein LOC142328230 n=1 Tax=Lycorma delicatula TaxID=130591 RepID=UPI003F51602D